MYVYVSMNTYINMYVYVHIYILSSSVSLPLFKIYFYYGNFKCKNREKNIMSLQVPIAQPQ